GHHVAHLSRLVDRYLWLSRVMRALRLALRALSAVAPGVAARVAARLWFAVPRPRIDDEARTFLATGTRYDVNANGVRLTAWRWGNGRSGGGRPPVLLMHGWGGYGGQLSAFVEPLTRSGYQVIAFDAASHGESAPGSLGRRRATLFDFVDALTAVSSDLSQIAGVIAHSGGCAATAWAKVTRPEWPVARMVFIAPFGSPARYMAMFQRALGFSDAAMRSFRQNTERQFDFRWADFEVPEMAQRAAMPPLLVIHDRGDRETSWEDGAAIAERWPSATLQTTTGLGHNRILRDKATVDAAVAFIRSDT